MRRARYVFGIAACLSIALSGCSSGSGSAGSSSDATLTVFAAASLTESFDTLKTTFEQANPGVSVTLSYGGSSTLAQQIVQGAPADVFAAASPATMKTVTDAGDAAGDPVVFASNTLAIVTPPGNTKVTGLADFADAALTTVVCAAPVPCGAAADKAFAAAKVTPSLDSREPDVKSVLAKVESGDADAGIVYVTDARAAGSKVREVTIPSADNVSTTYPIVAIKGTGQPDLAKAWIALVTGPEGQQVLGSYGFSGP